ncbi:C-C motif chemokine 19a.1 [Sander lucioperca]|uniref:Eotaxin-like n=1 Tax=Sander lucioperca TaxID=283035 RepID=A0A8C9XZ22_SANLU|nr:C-C motif chemokine 19a.1 [Sander lucioperca]
MAPWGDAKLFFCILFITCCCCTVTLAQIPMDCCLSVSDRPFEKARVVDYRRQISGHGCSIDAMIFVTRRSKKLCVPADKQWIQEVVKHVDTLKKICKKHHYKGKLCTGVKQE